MQKIKIQKIEEYTRSAFSALALKFNCENDYMNSFIRGSLPWDRGYGGTYVFVNEESDTLIGYYNISTGTLDIVEDGTRRKQGGTIHINMFAIDKS